MRCRWISEHDLEIDPPRVLQLDSMDVEAAKRTRSIIMFLGPLLHQYETFKIPFAGGCSLGTRTVEPHMAGLVPFGLSVEAANDNYIATAKPQHVDRAIILTERGDTVTENVVMAAALYDGKKCIDFIYYTEIRIIIIEEFLRGK